MVFSVIPKAFKINGLWLYTPTKNRRGKIRKVGQTDRYRRHRFRTTSWRWQGRSPRKAPGNLPLWFGPVLPLKIHLRVDKAYGRKTRKEIFSPTIGVTIASLCTVPYTKFHRYHFCKSCCIVYSMYTVQYSERERGGVVAAWTAASGR